MPPGGDLNSSSLCRPHKRLVQRSLPKCTGYFLLLNNSPLELFENVDPKLSVGFDVVGAVDVSDENSDPAVDVVSEGNNDVPPLDVVANENGFEAVVPDPNNDPPVVEPNRPETKSTDKPSSNSRSYLMLY